jgi:hypothetical protein
MNVPSLPLVIVLLHWFFDWFCQNDWMALNKSKRVDVLLVHALVATSYCLPLSYAFAPAEGGLDPLRWFWLNNLWAHIAIDALTSRCTSKLWFIELDENIEHRYGSAWPFLARLKPGYRHWFFVMIGFDQVLHYIVLAYSWQWLVAR